MRTLAGLALLFPAACAVPPPPSYWHLSVPVREPARGDAERLIRESAPLFGEVAEGWSGKRPARPELQDLLAKARKVERNLASALLAYLSLPPEAQDKDVIERRRDQLQDLLRAIRACIKEAESAL